MRAIGILWVCASMAAAGAAQAASAQRHLTLDDLFQLSALSHTTVSPDGEWIAAVVQRPALPGEVYGRTMYEMDPTRSDVWLISRRTGEKRNLTQGAKNAAGFWCATWSPDGRRLAMMSTQPAGNEPRGGDNIRLYVWERDAPGLKRLSSRAMMTPTLGGSPHYKVELRGGAGRQPGFARCSGNENAPFVWLDDTSLLAVMLPEGDISGLIDVYSRAPRHAGETLERLRNGVDTTVTAVESGAPAPSPYKASLQKIDVTRARAQPIADVPVYPFDGSLQITISPDGAAAAVLAGTQQIPHVDGRRMAYPLDIWAVDKQLGFVGLTPGASVRWLEKMPDEGRYILDMLAWSPDGAAVAVRGRPTPEQQAQSLFTVSARDLVVTQVSPPGLSVAENSPFWVSSPPVPAGTEIVKTVAGIDLWSTASDGGHARKLMTLNEHYAQVKFGERRLIDYRGIEGDALKGGVVLPPDYQPGRRYPTMVWVYAGSTTRELTSSFFDYYAPGIYNMHLYAARGYVVLKPSMPLRPGGNISNNDYMDLPKGVMPAVDRLIDLGIADPDRLAVLGQSYGGYSTYALVTYTGRFKAAIALAGFTDKISAYYQFDTTARGYPGIEHQKSVNWAWMAEQDWPGGGGAAPTDDLWRYLRTSPLYFADRVTTPLLLVHGEFDIRGPMTQAEEFFYSLYRQGKRARLLRYWGEDHGLRMSPANVRDIVDEIFKWMDLNMPEKPAAASSEAGSG